MQRSLVLVSIGVIGLALYMLVQQARLTGTSLPPTMTPSTTLSVPATPATVAATQSPLVLPTRAGLTTAVASPLSSPQSAEGVQSTTIVTANVTANATAITGTPMNYTYEVVAVYPHDANAFTQGLLFDEGILYEGTGLYGESTLRRVDLATGTVEQQIELPDQFFGEGITIVDDQLFQLTWREQRGFIYDKASFTQEGVFTYPTEGWGLSDDGEQLFMSDGSAQIFVLDPATLALVKTIAVHDGQGPVVRLNELEYIHGDLYANIWQTDRIAQIDLTTGAVIGWIDLTGLLLAADRTSSTDVLNGIAYLPTEDRLFVTGKKWPKLFEIRLIAQP